MGCTSSAPISDVNSHTAENEKTEPLDEKRDDSEKNDTNKKEEFVQTDFNNLECNLIQMLPTCDNLDQNLQLDRDSISPPDVVATETDSDGTDSNGTKDNEETISKDDAEEPPHKFSTFQEVVDQVVLDSILEDISKMPGLGDHEGDRADSEVNGMEPDAINNISKDEGSEEINDTEDNPEETASPSQSECSRATRWEALADIAAELPPTLAVDPLTGQIYSLSK